MSSPKKNIQENDAVKNNQKQKIIEFYSNPSPKILTRGKIKQSTLNKILEDINANCRKKK